MAKTKPTEQQPITPAHQWVNKDGEVLGLAFSIIVMLDGGNVGMPGFKVIPMPHPSDREYCKQNGENWYPTGCDIGGSLHEHWHQEVRK